MYSDLSLYYLGQIGITPWIMRDVQEVSLSNERHKLVILKKAKYSDKAQILLKRMLAFINCDENDVLIIDVDKSPLKGEQFNNQSPVAVLGFGLDVNQYLCDAPLDCPILSSVDPQALIENPSSKKKIFKDLMYINELIQRSHF